jgi:thiamine biosynthesis lipoprotein
MTVTSKLPSPMRRRALQIVAAAAMVPTIGLLTGKNEKVSVHAWYGVSLGGPASISIAHHDVSLAQRTIFKLRTEIERLEQIFSLYRHDSEISTINRLGRTDDASSDFIRVLHHALGLAQSSRGAFDPTVQPLWRLYSDHFRVQPDAGTGPDQAAIARTLSLVGYTDVELSGHTVRLAKAGMALTLNGLAQGHITDRVTNILLNEGFHSALVSIGETRAIGRAPEGLPWSIGVKNPQRPTQVARALELVDQSVSVSGGYGTPFANSGSHHIFDPRTGQSANLLLDVVVTAPSAMVADGLSTAIYVAGEQVGSQLVAAAPDVTASVTRANGDVAIL